VFLVTLVAGWQLICSADEIHDAAEQGDIKQIDAELDAGVDVNVPRGLSGTTPLHLAAANADLDAVSLLVSMGADVNAHDQYGSTPLKMAMRNRKDRLKIVQLLLKAGADPNDGGGKRTVLSAAVSADAEPAVFELLFKSSAALGGDENHGALFGAVHKGRAAVVKELLKRGVPTKGPHQAGQTLLMHATHAQSEQFSEPAKTFQALIDHGIDVNAVDEHGDTALHWAANTSTESHPLAAAYMQLLIEAGAKIDVVNKAGNTPLLVAAITRADSASVRVLLKAGANPNARDAGGNSVLHRASGFGRRAPSPDMVVALVEAGAKVSAHNRFGWTPLMAYASQPYVSTLEALLELDKGVNEQDHAGWTALMIAVGSSDFNEWMKWIRQVNHGPGRLKESDIRMTAGMSATSRNQVARVWALLSKGARADIEAKDGTTVYTLLEGRTDPSSVAIRELLKLDIPQRIREQEERKKAKMSPQARRAAQRFREQKRRAEEEKRRKSFLLHPARPITALQPL